MSNDLYAPAVKESDETVVFAIKMPKSLREQFKAHCAKHNIDMSEVIRRFMKGELAK